MRNIGYIAIIGLCVTTILFILYIAVLTFYPFKVIDVKNPQNLPVDQKVYIAGQNIYITFDYEKYRDIAPVVKKEIICNSSITDLIGDRRLPMGRAVVKLSHVIPLSTPTDDHCRIFIFLEYEVNPLQVQSYSLRTSEFMVVNPKL